MKILAYILFVLSLLLSLSIAFEADTFILESIDEAKKISKETKKEILLIFGSDKCVYCRMLKNDILEKKLGDKINTYILCFIDVDKNIREQYSISMIPDSRIIDSNNTLISINKGYEKNKYIEWIKNVK